MFALELLLFKCLSVSVCIKVAQIQALQKTSQATHWSICSFSDGIQFTQGVSLSDFSFTISFWSNHIWLTLTQLLTTATHNLPTSSNKGIIQVLQKDWGPLSIFASYINILQGTLSHGCFTYVTFEEYLTEWKMKTKTHSHQSLKVFLPKDNGIKYSLKKENQIRRD